MHRSLAGAALFLAWTLACGAAPSFGTPGPHAVPTFNSIGLYWAPPEGGEANPARVQFRPAGKGAWRPGLDPWFDERNGEYRGSLVELEPGADYEILLALASGIKKIVRVRTWSEELRIKRTVHIAPGTRRLVIEAEDSGDERGYVVFTGRPGANVIDQAGVEGDDPRDSCVVVKQGVHHVVIRGLVLRNCKRYGVYLERQAKPELEARTHHVVIEENEISGWGAFELTKPGSGLADNDGAIHCNYFRETDDERRPQQIVIQRNTLRDPRHSANPWQRAGRTVHPAGPLGVHFDGCGANHVVRFNDIYSANGNRFNDGIGGTFNFSHSGFPWADSDINGNRVSDVYDDAIEAEGANRNVRVWGNYIDRAYVAIANAATATGPLYVWRNVSHRMAGLREPEADPDAEARGPFIKAGSNHLTAVGGRAYYFHNTVLQPPGKRYAFGAGSGISKAGGKLYNIVSRNNIWQVHNEAKREAKREARQRGTRTSYAIRADGDLGPVDVDYDLYNAPLQNAGRRAERHGFAGRPVYATSGKSYPALAAQPGHFALSPESPGYGAAERIANFNDRYARPDVGAHQSGTPPMQFGRHSRRNDT